MTYYQGPPQKGLSNVKLPLGWRYHLNHWKNRFNQWMFNKIMRGH